MTLQNGQGQPATPGPGPGQTPASALAGIDPQDFFVPASNAQGQSERITIRVAPEWMRQLEILIESRVFPYDLRNDVIRHALQRHFDWLDEMRAAIPGTDGVFTHHKHVRAIQRLMQENYDRREYMETFDTMEHAVRQAVGDGQVARARTMVRRAAAEIRLMPADALGWRETYWSTLISKFQRLLELEDLPVHLGMLSTPHGVDEEGNPIVGDDAEVAVEAHDPLENIVEPGPGS